MDFHEFLEGEVRYSALERTFPDNARTLFARAEREAKENTVITKSWNRCTSPNRQKRLRPPGAAFFSVFGNFLPARSV